MIEMNFNYYNMKQITINDVHNALYDMLRHGAENMSDEELLQADFWYDLGMDEQEVLTLAIDLQRIHRIFLPDEVLQALHGDNNTVQIFLTEANRLLQDLSEE
jgi:hypothetical protein